MSTCKALISTAGFESICEAMYLGKPVMMVPVKGQYEQSCNAIDARLSGAGIISDNFDFNKMEIFLQSGNSGYVASKGWVDGFEQQFLEILKDCSFSKSGEKPEFSRQGKRIFAT